MTPLDDYFSSKIIEDVSKGFTAAYVLIQKSTQDLIGYYTLSNFAIVRSELSSSLERKMKYVPVPATLIGRLAIQRTLQHKGVGKFLLIRAEIRAYELSLRCASRIIVVDTIDEEARDFYKRNQFQKLQNENEQYFLDMGRVAAMVAAAQKAPAS